MEALFCMQLFLSLLTKEEYKVIARVDDKISNAMVGTRVNGDKDLYVAFAASTNSTAVEIMQARGYRATEMQCLIGTRPVTVYVAYHEVPRP
jgi:hypothetical protein